MFEVSKSLLLKKNFPKRQRNDQGYETTVWKTNQEKIGSFTLSKEATVYLSWKNQKRNTTDT